MSSIRANGQPSPPGPDDPLYYAPRSERSSATTQIRSDHFAPAPPLSRHDEMREEAFARYSRPLESQLIYETRRPRGLLAVAGAIAAAIGVTAILALVLFNVFPGSKSAPAELAVSISTPASATPAQVTTEDSESLLHGFQQFQRTQAGQDPAVSEPTSTGTAKAAPEKSPALLEKFMQWEQRK